MATANWSLRMFVTLMAMLKIMLDCLFVICWKCGYSPLRLLVLYLINNNIIVLNWSIVIHFPLLKHPENGRSLLISHSVPRAAEAERFNQQYIALIDHHSRWWSTALVLQRLWVRNPFYFRLEFHNCLLSRVCNFEDQSFHHNLSPQFKYMAFHIFTCTVAMLPAPSWLDSSIDRALH